MSVSKHVPWVRNIFILAFLFSLLFVTTKGYSQMNAPNDNIIPPSPEAAALSKYAQIPVGLYTGIPKITIPLVQLSGRRLSMPVSLSYHAGGNKVESFATRTGLGWNLNAGGCISRVVRGLPDEGVRGFLQISERFTYNSFLSDGSDEERYKRYDSASKGCLDTEPDVYSFNVNGITGTFTFNWDKTIVISCDQKIEINYTLSSFQFSNWTIKDANGTNYFFDVVELTNSFPESPQSTTKDPYNTLCVTLNDIPTSWFISRLSTPDNLEQMQFSYRQFIREYTFVPSEQKMHYEYNGELFPSAKKIKRIRIFAKELVSITTDVGSSIEFFSMPSSSSAFASLDSVLVKYDGEVIKKFAFRYDQSIGRLTLKSLQEFGKDIKDSLPPYSFIYNPISLPPMDSYDQDHWGYYNTNNYFGYSVSEPTLIPPAWLKGSGPASERYYYPGANRNPDIQKMQAGILQSISYPEGRITKLEYEPNDFTLQEEKIPTIMKEESVELPKPSSPSLLKEEKPFQALHRIRVSLNYRAHTSATIPGSKPSVYIKDLQNNVVFMHDGGNGIFNFELNTGSYILGIQAVDQSDMLSSTLSWEEQTSSTPVLTITRQIAGGLRVKSITDSGNLVQPTIQRFIYNNDDGTSSGVDAGQGVPLYLHSFLYRISGEGDDLTPKQVIVRSAANSYQAGLTQGSVVGYKKVTTLHGYNGEFGKSVSTFISPHEFQDIVFRRIPFQPETSYDFRRGIPKEEIVFKYENGTYQKVKKVVYEYEEKYSEFSAVKFGVQIGGASILQSVYYPNRHIEFARIAVGNYSVVSGLKVVSAIIDSTYYDDNSVSAVVNQTDWDENLQFKTSTTTFSSKGERLTSNFYYPKDFKSLSDPNHIIKKMVALHMHSTVIEQITLKTSVDGITRITGGNFLEYKLVPGTSNLIAPHQSYQLTINKPLTGYIPVANTTNGLPAALYSPVNQYAYDKYTGNLVRKILLNGQNEDYIWGYKGQYPIAQVTNSSGHNLFAYTDFETRTEFEGKWYYNTSSIYYSDDAKTGNSSYKGPGLRTIAALPVGHYRVSCWAKINPGSSNSSITIEGITKTLTNSWKLYEWNIELSAGKQLLISNNNNLIDALRLIPAAAQMMSYTYTPAIGMTHASDPNNKISTYLYDGLGRLSVVKDHNGDILKTYSYHLAR